MYGSIKEDENMNAVIELMILAAIAAYLNLSGLVTGIVVVVYIIWKLIGWFVGAVVVGIIRGLTEQTKKLYSEIKGN